MSALAIVDSHCHLDHLDLSNYNNDLTQALRAAHARGVNYILCPGVDLESFPAILSIAKRQPNVWAAVGVHPTEENAREPGIEELCELAKDSLVVGVGETGLDYAECQNDEEEKKWQQELFVKHIQAAKMAKKPLIIHSRLAVRDILHILRSEKADEVGGVMHCFTEDLDSALMAIELNFYISFSGIITFKNADSLRDVARKIPLDRVLLETDAPYLAPVPMRGKPNQPEYLRYTTEYFAALRGLPLEEVARQTTENFFRLFKFAKPV